MMTTIFKSVQKHKFIYALIAVVLYQFACALQGFDLSDEGWGMYFYQQIFKNPECVVAQMPYWITGVIGGVWNFFFPEGGFLGTRILGIIVVTGTFCLSYMFLKKSINSGWLIVGLMAQVLIVAGDPKPYGYNSLTAFFVLLTVIAFWHGLETNKSLWLFIGGLILGINVFVRIPNLAILPIVLLIPVYHYWKNGKVRLFGRQMGITIIGLIIGILLVIAAMRYWGYWAFFVEALTGVANSATDESNSHQFGRLMIRYTKNYWGILCVGGIVVISGCLYVWLRSKLTNRYLPWVLNIISIIVWVFLALYYNVALRHNDMYFTHFISYAGAILILFRYNGNNKIHLRYAALASLAMIICIPLGSDQGINTMWTSAWLALPLGTAYLCGLFSEKVSWKGFFKKYAINKKYSRCYLYIIFAVYFACGIYKNDNLAYYDPGSRFSKIYSINNPYCRFIYTGSYRANLMNELLPILEKYVKPNDCLLVYNFMPGINYMTDTRSYISNAWLWCLSGAELKQQLDVSVSKNKTLPVVLRQNFRATNLWGDYDPFFMDANHVPENILSRPDQIRAMNDFLNTNHYKTVWSNKYFDILLPDV